MSSATLGNLVGGSQRGTAYVPHDCARCPLSRGRTQVVPGEGATKPLAFFVGEAPGPDEDRLGRPFIGRAGNILRTHLRATGWKDEEVWITNSVKCFPHEVDEEKKRIRAPSPSEIEACRPHLAAELDALRPKLLIALGRTAAAALLGEAPALDEAHGKIAGSYRLVPVFVTFHPSGLHYRRGRLEEFVKDLRNARDMAVKMRT